MPRQQSEPKDPRHVARAEELARQDAVQAAMAAESERQIKEARRLLKERQNIEVFGKPL